MSSLSDERDEKPEKNKGNGGLLRAQVGLLLGRSDGNIGNHLVLLLLIRSTAWNWLPSLCVQGLSLNSFLPSCWKGFKVRSCKEGLIERVSLLPKVKSIGHRILIFKFTFFCYNSGGLLPLWERREGMCTIEWPWLFDTHSQPLLFLPATSLFDSGAWG